MKHFLLGFLAIILLAGGAFYYITQVMPAEEAKRAAELAAQQAAAQPKPEPKPLPNIIIDSPTQNTTVTGEIEVLGKAKGFWFFEGSFPMILKDQNGDEAASGIATAAEEWMTENYVPFIGVIDLTGVPAGQYYLELKRDNPSALPENDESLTIPLIVQ